MPKEKTEEEAWQEAKKVWDTDGLEGIKLFEKVAKKHNNPAVNFLIGLNYKWGDFGVKKNLTKSFEFIQKSALSGYEEGQLELCRCYANGDGTKKNLKKAINWAEVAINNGSLEAIILIIGLKHEENPNKEGMTTNTKAYLPKIELAIKKGDFFTTVKDSSMEAFVALLIFALPFQKAFDFLTQGAKLGNAECCYMLAEFLCENEERSSHCYDFDTALLYYEKAARLGHREAQSKLGWIYEADVVANNKQVLFDGKLSLFWHEKAAEKGHWFSKWRLGIAYLPEECHSYSKLDTFVRKKKKKAISFLRAAAKDPRSSGWCCHDAYFYFDEFALRNKSHEKQSLELLKLSAQKGWELDQYELAEHYLFAGNMEESLHWALEAARQGNDGAIYMLEVDHKVKFDVTEQKKLSSEEKISDTNIITFPVTKSKTLQDQTISNTITISKQAKEELYLEIKERLSQEGLVAPGTYKQDQQLDESILYRAETDQLEYKSSFRHPYPEFPEKLLNKSNQQIYRLGKEEFAKKTDLIKFIKSQSLKSIVGFLNSSGGILIIGVSESEDRNPEKNILVGVKHDQYENEDTYLRSITQEISNRIGIHFNGLITKKIFTHKNKQFCQLNIKPFIPALGQPVVFLDEKKCFVRTGNRTDELIGKQLNDFFNTRPTIGTK